MMHARNKKAIEEPYATLHRHSMNNMPYIDDDTDCGCFHCGYRFKGKEIQSVIKDKYGTACCPRCGIDSVLRNEEKYPLTSQLLYEMRCIWFGSVNE